MKNWTHDTIERLRKDYSESDTDLTRFFLEKFSSYGNQELNKAMKAKELLIEFEEKGLIKWKVGKQQLDQSGNKSAYEYDNGEIDLPEYQGYKGWKVVFGKSNVHQEETLLNNRIEARLTIDGLDYAIKLRRERWQYKIFLYTAIATAVFTGLAALFSGLQYYKKQEPINVKLQDSIYLKTEIKSKEAPLLQELPTTSPSPPKQIVKKTAHR